MRSERFLPYLVPLLAVVLLTVFESDLLYQLQEQNLFLHSTLFFQQQMVKAGGLLTWMGCYLTQFFYYPLLGAGILCLLWAFLMWTMQRTFRLADQWLTLIPVASLLLTIVTLGYWVYYLKLPGHAFNATIGTIIAIGLVWGYKLMPRQYGLSAIYIFLATSLGYLLFGVYALGAAVLMSIMALREGKQRLADAIVAVVTIIAVPIVSYYYIFHETNIVNIYWAALPVFCHQGERYWGYNIPYIVLFASIILMAVRPQLKAKKRVDIVVAVVIVGCLCLLWNRDDNLHRELSMTRSIEKGQWDKVLETARSTKGEPTRLICMMRNLALFKLEQPFNKASEYPEGDKRPAAPFTVHTVHTAGKLLYLQYGIPNYCYRWCMEDGVEYGWTVERLRLMAICSLLNNEPVATQRFLNLLKKTDFHKSWAKSFERYNQNPKLIPSAQEVRHILPLLRNDNFLTADQSQQEMFLIEHFLSTEGSTLEQRHLANFTLGYYRNNHQKLIEE